MSEVNAPSEPRPQQESQTISLNDVAQRYLSALQRMFDIATVAAEGMRQVNERAYDDFSNTVRFLPSQKDRRSFDAVKPEAERWFLKNLLTDAFGLVVPFLEDVRSLSEIARLRGSGSTDKAAVTRVLSEDRQKFLRMDLGAKFAHLESQLSITSPLSEHMQVLAKLTTCLTARDGLVSEADVNEGNELVVKLVTLQLMRRPASDEPNNGGHTAAVVPQVTDVRRAFAVGQRVQFEKADFLSIIVTTAVFVNTMMKSMHEYVLKVKGADIEQ